MFLSIATRITHEYSKSYFDKLLRVLYISGLRTLYVDLYEKRGESVKCNRASKFKYLLNAIFNKIPKC